MGQYRSKPGTPKSDLTPDGATSNVAFAVLDPKTQLPVANGALRARLIKVRVGARLAAAL